jgi:hypothetical protein
MKDDYPDLHEGTITVNNEPVVTGRIQWLEHPGRYKGMKFHTDPLTADQAQRIDEGPVELDFTTGDGKHVTLFEGTIRADSPVREGSETTILTPPNHGTWDLDL